jgi:hypothetical protein
MQTWKPATRRLLISGLLYLLILLLTGELQIRRGGAAIVFLILWASQLIGEAWMVYRSQTKSEQT